MRIALVLFALAVALLAAGFAYEQWATARDARLFPPPGRMVDVGSFKLHIVCQGDAPGPTVIIEAAGGMSAASYALVQDGIAKFAHVCAYDRSGLGWSERSPAPRSFGEIAKDLQLLLTKAAVPGPYILVGHSFGGLVVRTFAKQHSHEVARVVLVEAAEEGFVFRPAFMRTVTLHERMYQILAALQPFGIPRLWFETLGPIAKLPPAVRAGLLRRGVFSAMAREAEAYRLTPIQMRSPGGFGYLGNLPLVVVIGGQSNSGGTAESLAAWRAAQKRLAALSTNSAIMIAKACGHMVNLDCPDAFVAAVRRDYEAAQTGSELSAAN